MRLIDGDELKVYISTTFCDTCKRDKGVCSSCEFDDVFVAIDNAPTIEPVKHGEWIDTEFLRIKECSCCHTFRGKIEAEDFDYCPNCGAKMDKE